MDIFILYITVLVNALMKKRNGDIFGRFSKWYFSMTDGRIDNLKKYIWSSDILVFRWTLRIYNYHVVQILNAQRKSVGNFHIDNLRIVIWIIEILGFIYVGKNFFNRLTIRPLKDLFKIIKEFFKFFFFH